MKVLENEIIKILDSYLSEWDKLNILLTGHTVSNPEIDMSEIKSQVDKCIIELKRFKALKPIKFK